jgi:hypothetical protein
MPSRRKLSGMIPRLSTDVSLMVISEAVMAAIPIKLPISIISGKQPVPAPL